MGKYIDKDEVVVEIKRRKSELHSKIAELGTFESNKIGLFQEVDLYDGILSFLDTLEVKDINIEKESELIANKIMIGVQANKYHTNVYNTKRNDFNHSHLCFAARKGIELGLKAQKGE